MQLENLDQILTHFTCPKRFKFLC